MKIIYNENFNFDLGLLKHLHPFEGMRFRKIYDRLSQDNGIEFLSPEEPVSDEIISEFLSEVMLQLVKNRNGVLKALEFPRLPFITQAYLERKVLSPMRWGVAGTLFGAENALQSGQNYWNLSGGYHHAMRNQMEGFCVYNDIGITYQQLLKSGQVTGDDRILIIDTDAHHGNGTAHVFMDNPNVVLMDVYNASIYPTSEYTRDRVDIPMKLKPGTDGETYLECLKIALGEIQGDFRLAFVVAGTDVLSSDKLGGLKLTPDDVAKRERLTLSRLKELAIPAVITGGGGYSSDGVDATVKAVLKAKSEGL
ncbi:histone deacetylase 11 [Thalassolituus maritimus]|uniref:Histone deacetylase 11 n=1 Tax=Thalassolituus maritimus TaxID=484498 RepID=A0A1N7KQW1_9GAMM|nr:histone deacetylase [Thalassolituus maritimus]SIS63935.1 histone deacetylase 11 [Thalassolituus maritimus]